MKSKLLFILSLFITTISAQQTYDLPWTTNGSSANQQLSIDVFDMLGKMNFSDTSDDLSNYKLDVSNYRAGVYFVTISTNNIRVSNKFIKL